MRIRYREDTDKTDFLKFYKIGLKIMTGNNFLDSFIFALLSFLFYLIRYKKEKNDNPSSFDNSYDYYRMVKSWSPIIMFLLLSIIFLLF
jgi:hypothetical protein